MRRSLGVGVDDWQFGRSSYNPVCQQLWSSTSASCGLVGCHCLLTSVLGCMFHDRSRYVAAVLQLLRTVGDAAALRIFTKATTQPVSRLAANMDAPWPDRCDLSDVPDLQATEVKALPHLQQVASCYTSRSLSGVFTSGYTTGVCLGLITTAPGLEIVSAKATTVSS